MMIIRNKLEDGRKMDIEELFEKLPKYLRRLQYLSCLALDVQDGLTMNYITKKYEISKELTTDIIENYDELRDKICGWD